jgi:hypothetical protein
MALEKMGDRDKRKFYTAQKNPLIAEQVFSLSIFNGLLVYDF